MPAASGDIAAGAGAILHHELLAEMVRQPLAMMRATVSTGPPAEKPIIQRTGRVG